MALMIFEKNGKSSSLLCYVNGMASSFHSKLPKTHGYEVVHFFCIKIIYGALIDVQHFTASVKFHLR
jgi:hypothetical protein